MVENHGGGGGGLISITLAVKTAPDGAPEDADTRMRSNYQRWSKVVKEAGIKAE